MLNNSPNSLEPYNAVLFDLSNDTFNYWEMKNSEAHSVVFSMVAIIINLFIFLKVRI